MVAISPPTVRPLSEYTKVLIRTEDELTEMFDAISNAATVVGFDIETTSLNTLVAALVGGSFYWGSGTAYYCPAPLLIPQILRLQEMFDSKLVVIHNAKYEDQVCRMHQMYPLSGRWTCSQVEDYIVNPDEAHGLKDCEKRYFGWDPRTYEECFGETPLDLVHPEQIYEYACVDAIGAYELHLHNRPRLEGLREILALDLAVLPIVSKMEHLGIPVDVEFLSSYKIPLQNKIDEARAEIFRLAGTEFEIDSPAQVGEILHGFLGIPAAAGRTKTGRWKTSALALEQLANRHPIVPKIIEYRELVKMKTNYVDSILDRLGPDGICRPSYLQCAVPTGRLASSRGNLTGGACNIQQIPKRGKILTSTARLTPEEQEVYRKVGATLYPIEGSESSFDIELPVKPRRAFVARPGYYILSADYKAIEFRIMVVLANEIKIIAEILGGVDVHVATACDVFGVTPDKVSSEMRESAKTLNYAVLYGMDYHGLMTRLKITEEEARLIYTRFMQRIPNIQAWIKQVQEFAKKNHYIKTYFGRRRYLNELIKYREIADPRERKRVFARGLRGSVNSVVQGTGADIMKMAMVRVDAAIRPFGDDFHQLAPVHDQVLCECRKTLAPNDMMGILREAMQFPIEGWDLPMEVEFEIGPNWGDVKKAYYEVPNRTSLEVKVVTAGVTPDMLKKARDKMKKYPGSKQVNIHMSGSVLPCKEKVLAADDICLDLKGIFGASAEVAWI